MDIGNAILLSALIFLGVATITCCYVLKQSVLGYISAGIWLLASILSYSLSAGAWDIYYALAILGFFMVVLGGLSAFATREGDNGEEGEAADGEASEDGRKPWSGRKLTAPVYQGPRESIMAQRYRMHGGRVPIRRRRTRWPPPIRMR